MISSIILFISNDRSLQPKGSHPSLIHAGPLRIERRSSGLEAEVLTIIRWTYLYAEDVGFEPTLPFGRLLISNETQLPLCQSSLSRLG